MKRTVATGGGYARTTWTEYSKWDKDSEAVLAAQDLADWFKDEVFGTPKIIKDKNKQKAIENDGKSYIIFFLHPVVGYDPTTDHIDLWDGKNKVFKRDRIGKNNPKSERFEKGAKEMWLWEVKK